MGDCCCCDDETQCWPTLDDVVGGATRVLIIHHWDTDGICTAAMLQEALEPKGVAVRLFCPTVGNFFLSEADRKAIASRGDFDRVIVVDYALPVPDMTWLVEQWPTAQIDHHLLKHDNIVQINPVVDGVDPTLYPSACWVTTAFLGRKPDLLSVYGVIGDVGTKAMGMPVWDEVSAVMEAHGLDIERVQEIVDLLDSSYKVGDRNAVVAAVPVVRKAAADPQALIDNEQWKENLVAIDREMDRLISLPTEERAGLTVIEFETRFNLISAFGRHMAAESGAAFCINRGYFDDRDQLYLRRTDGVTVGEIIDAARERGYSAGGKAEVVGIVVPKEESQSAIDLVYDLSERKMNE